MGELSKYVGEIGEDIAKVFFQRIGWGASLENESLSCLKQQKHKEKNTEKRNTHGIDRLFSYISSVEYYTVQNVFISCKNTSNEYLKNPVSKFKEYMGELIWGLECFKRSVKKRDILAKFSGYSNSNDVGVLFWISIHENTYDNLIEKIKSARIESDFEYGNIYIIDNEIVNFHMKALDYIEEEFKNHEWSYYLTETAIAYGDKSITRKTKTLPVEYINSNYLSFVLEDKELVNAKPKFLIITKDNFNSEALGMYINAAREFTSEMTTDYHFSFPDYNKAQHQNEVNESLMNAPDNLIISVKVNTYNSQGVRGMIND